MTRWAEIGYRILAYMCDFISGMFGGWVDLSPYLLELTEPPEQEAIDMTPHPFTAWAVCPKCGQVDCHLMRQPKPAPTADEMQAWRQQYLDVDIDFWMQRGGVSIKPFPPPVDESQYEVIRICQCGYEFGQI